MNALRFVFDPSSSLPQQMDTSVHLEKPYQVEAIGPPYASFDIVVESQRFWGRNASHMELSICFKYSSVYSSSLDLQYNQQQQQGIEWFSRICPLLELLLF